MDRRVSAVTLDTNLGLDRRGTSTDLLENITVICLPKVLGIAGSHFERREFRLFSEAGEVVLEGVFMSSERLA